MVLHNTLTSAKDKYKILLGAIYELISAVMDEQAFSTADHIQAVKGEKRDGKKYQYVANYVKLWGIVSNKGAFNKRLFLHFKHTGAWMSVQSTTLMGTVLAATKSRYFYVLFITLTPLTFKINTAVACRTFWCVTREAAATEVLSLHVKIRYVTISPTFRDKPSSLPAYAANP